LWNYPEKKAKIRGMYSFIIERIFKGFKEGKRAKEVLKKAFSYKRRKIDIDKLEAIWKKYWRDF
jgi:hypothetical protein